MRHHKKQDVREKIIWSKLFTSFIVFILLYVFSVYSRYVNDNENGDIRERFDGIKEAYIVLKSLHVLEIEPDHNTDPTRP